MKFKRACAGLYVDSTETFVISREARNLYSIRLFLNWGATSDGTPMPDYGHIWYGDTITLAEAKLDVEEMVQQNFVPTSDIDWINRGCNA